ncbi:P22 phage major capsid protein family protein [Streptomyces ovatisporus]|uniref:P22 phage major capsid protein family protein n=1 Tax=Streptomyces ovatisporus TaxID=1128682 RepID=A0ABV9A3N0_9ACTN
MAVTNFIPEIWNASIMENFHASTVAVALANREYEGNLAHGNTVKITGMTDVAVRDYTIGEGNGGTVGAPLPRTTAAEAISTSSQDLVVDKEKSFDFYVDDIDRVQVAGTLEPFTRSAGEALAQDADRFLLSTAVTGATVLTDTVTSALASGDDALNVIRDLRKAMNKLYVPQAGRVLVINAEFEAVLLDASSRIMNVDTSGSSAGLRDASVGRLLGFEIYVSENLPTTATAQALALHRPSLAYVSQVEKTEAMRAQDKFADRLRGLHVYGGKVVRAAGVHVWTDDTTP